MVGEGRLDRLLGRVVELGFSVRFLFLVVFVFLVRVFKKRIKIGFYRVRRI